MAESHFASPFVEREARDEARWEPRDARAEMFDIVSPFAPARSLERDSTSSFGEAEALEGYETSPETSFEDVGVIDGDDRAPVTPTTDVPWRWMCHIQIKDSRGRLADHGTGLLISNCHVLTAAHIVSAASVDPQLYTVEVRPGRDDAAEPFGLYTSSRIRVCSRYQPSADDHFEWDYALITLGTPIGKKTFKSIGNQPLGFWGSAAYSGLFDIGPGDPAALVQSTAVTAGYPGGKQSVGTKLWLAKGRIRQVSTKTSPNSIWITADTTKGQSGSPVWVDVGKSKRLIGVATGASTQLNRVRRANPDMSADLRSWIMADGEPAWMREAEGPDSYQAEGQDWRETGERDFSPAAREEGYRAGLDVGREDSESQAFVSSDEADALESESEENELAAEEMEEELVGLLPERTSPPGLGEASGPSSWDETPELPPGLPQFIHMVQPLKRHVPTGTWTPDGPVAELTPLDPGFLDASRELKTSSLHAALGNLLTTRPEFRKYLTSAAIRDRKATAGDRLRVALVDLTEKRLIEPEFAGWGSVVAVDGASCPKVAPLYAVFQLKHDLEQIAARDKITTFAGLVGAARKRWKHVSAAPNPATLLDDSVDPPGLVFRQQIKDAIKKIISRHDANEAARILIAAAGFPYIGSLLWQSGLRHPTRGGLWLTSSYNSRVRWEPAALPPPRPIFGHTATALSMATYFTLLAQGRLVNSSTSLEIKRALSTASWWRPKLGSGPLPDSAKIASKVGLLLLCTKRDPKNEKKCVASIATHVHEAGLIENGRFRYAVAMMTVGIPEGVEVLTKLITEIDALIRANNP